MAAILDMSQFTFNGEVIQAVNELVFDAVLEAPEISLFHTVFSGIVTDKEVGFITGGGIVGKKAQGCDPQPHAFGITTRKLKWTPEEWEVLIHACYKDLRTTAAAYSLKTGTAIADFTTSDYMNIVVEVLGKEMKKFILRTVWFTNVNADNVTDGGEITDGIDPTYFDLIDGLWKQMLTQVTAKPAQKVTIAENAGANYAAQALVPANVRDTYLPGLIYGAPMTLRGMEGTFILCTQSFADGYKKSLTGKELESMYTNLVSGMKVLTFDGLPLIPVPMWDLMIAEYNNTGTKLINPHRAIFTHKDFLGIGCDDESSFGDLDIWYDKDSRKVKMEGMGIIDSKLMNPEMFMLAI